MFPRVAAAVLPGQTPPQDSALPDEVPDAR
jgi:hypothetical protein